MPSKRPGMALKKNVIIIDPGKSMDPNVETHLQARGIRVRIFGEARPALKIISPQWNGALVIYSDLPVVGGWRLLEQVKQMDPNLPVVMILGRGDTSRVVKAMRRGAYDVLLQPISSHEVQKTLLGALEKRSLILEKRKLHLETEAKDRSEQFVRGRSSLMERLSETIRKAGEVDAEVILVGHTGTGKKMIARGLHDQSPRRHHNFVTLNCSSISEEALERDLFGHGSEAMAEESFRSVGKLQPADKGTLYLEKIECLPLRLQDRLLHVLQEGTLEGFGSSEPKPIDVRVIASTNGDLKNACAEGRFREGLFYRLNLIQIVLPSLKEHLEDIPILFQHFVLQACRKYYRPTPLMTSEILLKLLNRDWPGNVRELKNLAERFALGFGMDSQNPPVPHELVSPDPQSLNHQITLVEKMDAFEKNLIVQELTRTKGSVKDTYAALGLPRKTFYDKMSKHNLTRKDFLAPKQLPRKISALHKIKNF